MQRTPVENPYCHMQRDTDRAVEVRSITGRGLCLGCGRYVNLRKNGTTKLHRVYGRRDMARRVAHWKRTGEHS